MPYPIVTVYACPPIPVRDCDWAAFIEGREEWITGRGATRDEAVADLFEQIDERTLEVN